MTEWRAIPGTNGNYFASEEGHIRGRRRQGSSGAPLKPWWSDGYGFVNIHVDGTQRLRPVHQLVLEAFVGPRADGMECRHLDGEPVHGEWSFAIVDGPDDWGHAEEDAAWSDVPISYELLRMDATVVDAVNAGEISQDEFHAEMRFLADDRQQAAEEAAQEAYDREMGAW